MGYKIAVHRDAVFICVKVYPLWFNVNYAVTLLQDKDVACDLRACVCPKRIVGKPYRTSKLGSLCDILPHLWACFVHRPLRGDEHHNAACPHFIQSLCNKIVVD